MLKTTPPNRATAIRTCLLWFLAIFFATPLAWASSDGAQHDQPGEPAAAEQSIGAPDLGHLRNGKRLHASKRVRLRFPANTWGTTALVDGIHACTDAVRRKHGRSHTLLVGDMSRKGGGMLRPHEGHQNGREADIGVYMRRGKPLAGLWRLAPSDIDAARTLTFLECWIDSGTLQRVFLDRSLQAPLVQEAKRRGWSAKQLRDTFSYPRPGSDRVGLVQHRSHHDNHIHLRLRCADHEPRCRHKPYGAKARRALAKNHGSHAARPAPSAAIRRAGNKASRHRKSRLVKKRAARPRTIQPTRTKRHVKRRPTTKRRAAVKAKPATKPRTRAKHARTPKPRKAPRMGAKSAPPRH